MPLFTPRNADERKRTMIEELELLVRRIAVLPLLLPALLFAGWTLGDVTADGMARPGTASVRIAAASFTPRAQLETLSAYMHELRGAGENTAEYVRLYTDHVQPVESSLRKWGIMPGVARRVAWPLVENAYANGLDPATVVAVVLVESSGKPTARSIVDARGLMQIMPIHEGQWGCGLDLYDIEANLCYGTRILAANLARFRGDEDRALLAYNGCVNGTNTPNCHTYPSKVRRMRALVRAEWARLAPESYATLVQHGPGPFAAGP